MTDAWANSQVAADSADGPVARHPYRPATARARWAKVLIGIAAAIYALTAFTMMQLPGLIERAESGLLTQREAAEFDAWMTNLEAASILAPVAAAIAFLMWIYRITKNVPALTGGSARWSAGWAVGFWFIPVAFLFMPLLVVRDLYRRLADDMSRGWMVVLWWLAFAGGNVLARAGGYSLERASTAAEFNAAVMMGVVGVAAAAVSAIPIVLVISAVERGSAALALASHATNGAASHLTTSHDQARPTIAKEVKVCPDCAEPVRLEAKICRYCRHAFAPASRGAQQATGKARPIAPP